MPDEIAGIPAERQERAQREPVDVVACTGVGVLDEPTGVRVEPLDLAEHPQVRGLPASRGWANRPARPRAPAYSSPHPSQVIDMLISVGWVATPSSANRRSRFG